MSTAAHKMSAFLRCTDTIPAKEISLADVFALVTGGKLAAPTAKVRKALADAGGDKRADAVARAKKALPCVTFSGTGPGHKAVDLREHSGLVQLDFDEPKPPKEGAPEEEFARHKVALALWHKNLPALFASVTSSPHVAFAADSATGTGIKAALFVVVPEGLAPAELQQWHREAAFPAAQHFARQTFGAEIDSSCCDPMRLAFLGHHPGAYFNPEATPLAVLAVDNAENADNAEGLLPKSRSGFADAMHRAEAREDFAKWANEAGFTGDLRELDLPELFKSHGFTAEKRTKGLAIACPWQGEHSTGSNGTDTMILRSEGERGFPWGFECRHEHCQHRGIRDVLAELESRKPGSVDAHCRKAYSPATIAEEAEPEEALPAPPFPLDALNPVARAVIADIADIADVDCALPGAAALAVLAASIGKGALALGATRDLSKTTPANLLLIASAPPAYGKSAVEPVLEPLRRINAEMESEFDATERGGLEAELAECDANKKRITNEMGKTTWAKKNQLEKDAARRELSISSSRMNELKLLLSQPPQIIVGSATGAALGLAMKRNEERLFSFGYESADIIRVALGRYSNDNKGDFDLILSSYTGEPFRENRAIRGNLSLKAPCLSAFWLCQPSVLAEAVGTQEARERGMLARLCYSINERDTIPHESAESRTPDADARSAWDDAITSIHGHFYCAERPMHFPATHEAREVFRALHNRGVDERNGPFREEQDLMGRLRENAIRFALGQAVLDGMTLKGVRQEITAEQARRGVALAEWALYSLLRFLGPARHKRRQDRLRDLVSVLAEYGGECTLRILRDSHGFKPEEVKRFAVQFSARLAIEKHGTRRKGEICLLRPSKQNP